MDSGEPLETSIGAVVGIGGKLGVGADAANWADATADAASAVSLVNPVLTDCEVAIKGRAPCCRDKGSFPVTKTLGLAAASMLAAAGTAESREERVTGVAFTGLDAAF